MAAKWIDPWSPLLACPQRRVWGFTLCSVLVGCGLSADEQVPLEPESHLIADTTALRTYPSHPESSFFQVVGGAIRGDTVVIAERSSASIYVFDGSGRLVQRVGRRGEGPGEFQSIRWIQFVGSRLVAYDWDLDRVTTFESSGKVVRTVRIRPSDQQHLSAAVVGVFSDESLCVWQSRLPTAPAFGIPVRKSGELWRYSRDGVPLELLGAVLSSESFSHQWPDEAVTEAQLVLGVESGFAVFGDRLFAVERDEPVVRIIGLKQPESVLRLKGVGSRRVVTSSDRQGLRRAFVRGSSARYPLADVFDRMPSADSFPLFGSGGVRRSPVVKVASDGVLWISAGRSALRSPIWFTVSANSSDVETVGATDEVQFLDAVGDRVLVVTRDQEDLERVELRLIVRRAR